MESMIDENAHVMHKGESHVIATLRSDTNLVTFGLFYDTRYVPVRNLSRLYYKGRAKHNWDIERKKS